MPSRYFVPQDIHVNYQAETLQGEFYCDVCEERQTEAKWFTDAPADAHAFAWQCSKGHITKKFKHEVMGA